MKYLSFLIKPASSSCNLKCKYCFYTDVSNHRSIQNSGMMTYETMHHLIDEAFKNIDEDGELTFSFQGGEPFISGLAYFKEFIDYVEIKKCKQQKIHYAIQTNATLIDDNFCVLLKKYNFLVGISLDGYKENHDFFRITKDDKSTFTQVMKAIELLKKYKIEFNILTVLSKQLAKHPKKLYEFYKKHDFEYIQLIPCLSGLEANDDLFALTPQLFSSFYKEFYKLWFEDYQKDIHHSFNLFDNLILMYNGYPPYQCGYLGNCTMQLVVESDGSIYPCDFYVLDHYKGGNINTSSLTEIVQNENMIKFIEEEKKLSLKCQNCYFKNICNGNCKRMSDVFFDENYCGYKDFLTYSYQTLSKIKTDF